MDLMDVVHGVFDCLFCPFITGPESDENPFALTIRASELESTAEYQTAAETYAKVFS